MGTIAPRYTPIQVITNQLDASVDLALSSWKWWRVLGDEAEAENIEVVVKAETEAETEGETDRAVSRTKRP